MALYKCVIIYRLTQPLDGCWYLLCQGLD